MVQGRPMEVEPTCTLLPTLPRECIILISAHASLSDMCRLSMTCRSLHGTVESLWPELCKQWEQRQPREAFCDLSELQRMTSHMLSGRGMALMLHRLGAWPVGLWIAQNLHSQCEASRLVSVKWTPSGFQVSNMAPSGAQGLHGNGRRWANSLNHPGWMTAGAGIYVPGRSLASGSWTWQAKDDHAPELSKLDPGGYQLTMFERFPWFDQRANFGYGNALRKVTFARVKLLPELLDTIVPQGQPIPKGLYPLHDLQVHGHVDGSD